MQSEKWISDDKDLIERVRTMRIEKVRKLLGDYRDVSGYNSRMGKSSPAVLHNRLMVCLTEGSIPISALS